VGLSPASAAFISQLESGVKVPSARLADALAQALDDDSRIYQAWSRTGRRADPITTAQAVRELHQLLGDPRLDVAAAPRLGAPEAALSQPREPTSEARPDAVRDPTVAARPVPPGAPRSRVGDPRRLALRIASGTRVGTAPAPCYYVTHSEGAGAPPAWVLVPELREGADPGGGGEGVPAAIAVHRVDPASLASLEPLVRPFAYRLSAEGARRLRDQLRPGEVLILTRRTWPLDTALPYAVRLGGRIELGRVMWNGRELLLLPAPGGSDFTVVEAPSRDGLEALLAGKVVASIPVAP
jgi:hypothetical protein